LLGDERREGRVELLLEILNSLGDVSEDLKTKITREDNVSILAEWTKLAVKISADSGLISLLIN